MWSIFSYAYLSSVYLLWWGIYNGLCPILKSGFLFFLLLNFFQTWFFGEGTKQEDFSNIQHENENATSVFHDVFLVVANWGQLHEDQSELISGHSH